MRLRFDFAAAVERPSDCSTLELRDPVTVLVAHRHDEVRAVIRDAERHAMAGAWVAGFVTYEAAPALDTALATHPPTSLPLAWFAIFRAAHAGAAAGPDKTVHGAGAAGRSIPWRPAISADDYQRGFDRVRHAIADGDSYQANYTMRLRAPWPDDDIWPVYTALVAAHRSPYAACLDLDEVQILSLSPELLFERRGRRLVTRPMKGTGARGRWADEDLAQAARLAASPKDRAENVMIVDLARNDLGRVAEIGSVAATDLFEVQRYPNAWQMVSTVSARARPGTDLTEIFAALFPAGSVTGAPKASSMRLIREIEPEPRGLYCGTIGLLTPGGDATFNVAIRTTVIDKASRIATLGVGGGITWDSQADAELSEAHLKARFLELPPRIDLLETMRFDGSEIVRWPRHLARLLTSAAWFDIAVDSAAVTAVVMAHVQPWRGGSRRVRLVVSRDGQPHVTSVPFVGGSEVVDVAMAATPVRADDTFLCHKTTHRTIYDDRRAERPDVFDVLLENHRGELTEFTIGNLVIELNGERLTPRREAGLLAGVFRAELIDTGQIREATLRRADLARARAVWLVNSLREWVPVRLRP